jgi:hypothetical protein
MTRGTRRRADDRGAALVEFVLVLPVLTIIVFGIIEFGAAWSNKLKVETAARAGARVASGLGPDRLADYSLLQSVKSVLTEFGLSNVDYVVVYNASDPDGAIPAGCSGSSPTSQTAQCNVYTGSQLETLTQDDFTGTTSCGSDAPDRWWCPTARQNVQHLGNDYVGVWIKAKSKTLTNLFGSPLGLQSSAVLRIEPKG